MRFLTILLSLCISFTSLAASVWEVSKDGNSIYIGGTIHLLSADDYPLPDKFEQAYKAADSLVFETDIVAMSSPEFQTKAAQMMSFEGNKTIYDVLQKETISALETHLNKRGLPLSQLAKLKPGMLSITLSLIEFQLIGLTSAGVDQFYSDKARNDGKTQTWLETPDEQLAFLANMGAGQENSMIMYTLRDIKNLPTMITQLKDLWRKGDLTGMDKMSIAPFKSDYPEVYDDLLVKRNNNWLPHIEKMLTDKPKEFVLVGALHLVGEDSVLTMLENKGYKIIKL